MLYVVSVVTSSHGAVPSMPRCCTRMFWPTSLLQSPHPIWPLSMKRRLLSLRQPCLRKGLGRQRQKRISDTVFIIRAQKQEKEQRMPCGNDIDGCIRAMYSCQFGISYPSEASDAHSSPQRSDLDSLRGPSAMDSILVHKIQDAVLRICVRTTGTAFALFWQEWSASFSNASATTRL